MTRGTAFNPCVREPAHVASARQLKYNYMRLRDRGQLWCEVQRPAKARRTERPRVFGRNRNHRRPQQLPRTLTGVRTRHTQAAVCWLYCCRCTFWPSHAQHTTKKYGDFDMNRENTRWVQPTTNNSTAAAVNSVIA